MVRAAVLYVIRTLIDAPVPLNEGFLRPVTIRVPEGSMLSPRYPAAGVAGNVETSQVVTDALFGALPLAVESGTGSELRFPLGISIIGGLLLSQLLTLYTTPVIYLALDRLNRRLETRPPPDAPAAPLAGATEGIQ